MDIPSESGRGRVLSLSERLLSEVDMARRKRILQPKLRPAIRTDILRLVQTWPWLSVQGFKTGVPTPAVGRDIPLGSTSPTLDWLNKYDPDYEGRLALCEATLDKLDAMGGVDWPAVLHALTQGWNAAYQQAWSDPDSIREWVEDLDLVKKMLKECLRRSRVNPLLAGPWRNAVQDYLDHDDRARLRPEQPTRRPRAGQPSKPWVETTGKALRDAGVPAEEAEDLMIALRLRNPRE